MCRGFIMIVCAGVSDSVFHENFINGLIGALAASDAPAEAMAPIHGPARPLEAVLRASTCWRKKGRTCALPQPLAAAGSGS